MKINSTLAILIAASTIVSCSGVRNTAGPSGPITPSSGSASNVSSGRGVGAPLGSDETTRTSATADLNAKPVSDSGRNKLEIADKDSKPMAFMHEAALNGAAEVRLSQLALTKANNEYVKAFASMTIKDYGAANEDLNKLAALKNFKLDMTTDNKIYDEQITQLTSVNGEDFENLYIQMMLNNHQQAVSLFEEGQDAGDPEVSAYAKKYIPVIKAHVETLGTFKPR